MRSISRLAVTAAALLVGATVLVASEESVRLARVIEKPEDLATVFTDAQTSVTYDSATGRFYYPSLGLYFDPVTSLFYDPKTGQYRDQALQGNYSVPMADGMYYDVTTGLYYDAQKKMSFNRNTGIYHDQELDHDLTWEASLGIFYDLNTESYYDPDLGKHLSYNPTMKMFYDTSVELFYDISLGMYYHHDIELFYDSIADRYYDDTTGLYIDTNGEVVSVDSSGHLIWDMYNDIYYCDLDGHHYSLCDNGLFVSTDSVEFYDAPCYLDPKTGFHLIYDEMLESYRALEMDDLYDPESRCYYDIYNKACYRFEKHIGAFVDPLTWDVYVPWWNNYVTVPFAQNSSQYDLSNMYYDEYSGLYYDYCSYRSFDPAWRLFASWSGGLEDYDGNECQWDSDRYCYYCPMTGEYFYFSLGEESLLNMQHDYMSGVYRNMASGWEYDPTTGLFFRPSDYRLYGIYFDSNGNAYRTDWMNGYFDVVTNERYVPRRTFVDMSSMVYDETSGLYRDWQTGRMYDKTTRLFFDGMYTYYDSLGNSYYYDSDYNLYYDAYTNEIYDPQDLITGLTLSDMAAINEVFYGIASQLNSAATDVCSNDGEQTKYDRAYYVAPRGASDAVWFDRLFKLGTDYSCKKIRLRRGVFPQTINVLWADGEDGGESDFHVSDIVLSVSGGIGSKMVSDVEILLYNTWTEPSYSVDFRNYSYEFYDDSSLNWISGVDSFDDYDAYKRYANDSYYSSLFMSAVYRGCWYLSGMLGYESLDTRARLTYDGMIDSDGDGLSDLEEIPIGTNPFMFDTDSDGMSDALELRIGSDPTWFNEDGDGDGMADVWEEFFGFNPSNPLDARADSDHDGLINLDECQLGTNPLNADTDGDGLRDKAELTHCTLPCNPDTDHDGVPDGTEVKLGANPLVADTDGDGLKDGLEIALGSSLSMADTDNDGLDDFKEFIAGTNPLKKDSDGDGIDDATELYYESDPLEPVSLSPWILDYYLHLYFTRSAEEARPIALAWGEMHYLDRSFDVAYMRTNDSDGDYISDWAEFLMETDPLDADTDHDGLDDTDEVHLGTDPRNPDSDGDGLSDGQEILYGTDPLNECSLRVGLKDGFAILFKDCYSPLDIMPDGRTAYEHALYTGDVHGEIDDNSALGSGQARVTIQVKSYVGHPATLHVGDLEIPLLPNSEMSIKVNVPFGEDVEVYSDFRHWEYGDSDAEKRYLSEFGNSFDYYNEKVEFSVTDANEFTVFRNDCWYPGEEGRHLLTSYSFPKSPLCIHDKASRELDKYFEDVEVDTYTGDRVVCEWELVESTKDVAFTDMSYNSYSVAVHVKASFPDSERRHCRLTYHHPNYVAGPTSKILEVRYCPEFHNPELSKEISGINKADGMSEEGSTWHSLAKTTDAEVESYLDQCPLKDETNSVQKTVATDQLTLRKYQEDKSRYFNEGIIRYSNILDPQQVKYQTFRKAPSGYCCPCPDHAHGHILVSASSRVDLFKDNSGRRLDEIDIFPTAVYTVGRRPSCDIEDALVAFTTNGEEYVKRRYTVLGVNIEVPHVDLDAYNKLSDKLGMPILVGTNVFSTVLETSDAASSEMLRSVPKLDLQCNVGLKSGVVRLSFADVKGHFKLLAIRPDKTVQVLLDTANATEGWQRQFKIEDWWKLADSNSQIRLVAVERGSCTLHFSYGTVRDGKLYRDAVSQRFTAVYPLLLPDYNRDGKIDDDDAYSYQNGRMYYFWCNKDGKQWSGDVSTATSDSVETVLNSYDGKINGRMDLVNFAPFAVTVSSIVTNLDSKSTYCLLSLETKGQDHGDNGMNFTLVNTKWSELKRIHNEDVLILSDDCSHSKMLHEAPLTPLHHETDAYEIKESELDAFKSNPESGLLVGEFSSKNVTSLKTRICYIGFSEPMAVCFELPVKILDVFEMLRWINIRKDFMQVTIPTSVSSNGVKWPDSEHANANMIFIHGYNVNEKESREWGRAVFKHFWWSGLDAGFTIVSWAGSIGQKQAFGGVTPDFFTNITSAVSSAPILVDALKEVPGKHFIMAHSLGNFLTSVAKQDYGLDYQQFFMVNAAVPIEAYDSSTNVLDACATKGYCTHLKQRIAMTPSSWWSFNPVYYCNHWYDLFSNSDGRHGLTWKDRFKDVDKTVNYYSSQDEVLANGDGSKEFLFSRDHVWYNGEHHKGKLPKKVFGGKCSHAGWGFRSLADRFKSKEKNKEYLKDPAVVKHMLKTKPFFNDFSLLSLYSPRGSSVASDYMNRQRLLAFEIPAESFAVGANPVPMWDEECATRNVDMADFISVPPMLKGQKWKHSAFATRSHHRVHELYESIVNKVKDSMK